MLTATQLEEMFLNYLAKKRMVNKKTIQADLGLDRRQANWIITRFWNRSIIDREYIDGVAYWKIDPKQGLTFRPGARDTHGCVEKKVGQIKK